MFNEKENFNILKESLKGDINLPESLSGENIVKFIETENAGKSKKRKGVVRRFVAVGVAACLVITGVSVLYGKGFFSAPENLISDESIQNQTVHNTAKDYDELLGFIKEYAAEYVKNETNRGYWYTATDDMIVNGVVNESIADGAADFDEKNESAEFSVNSSAQFGEVNLREENVYENDILITDGKYFYCVDKYGRRLSIVKANADGTLEKVYEGEETEHVDGNRVTENLCYSGLYLLGNKLIATYTRYIYEEENYYYSKELTGVAVYDITDKSAPVLLKEISIDGSYISSRIIDGELILISRYTIAQLFTRDDEEGLIPSVYNGELKESIPCDCIVYSEEDTPEAYVNIAKINLLDLEKDFSVTAFLGNIAETYCTRDTLYTIGYKYQYSRGGVVLTDDVVVGFGGAFVSTTDSKTTITKVDISGEKPEILCKTEFEGSILNSYSIDEHESFLRVAVTKGFSGEENCIYVFDENLCKVGEITGIAKGELIKSARFMGDTAYIVTFVQTDPLFVIDLTDPAKPEITGEVKLPGFSSYLHPVGDGLLVGIGVGGTETGVDGSSKISLFDVTDPAFPKEIDSLSFPTSSLVTESKAFVSITESSFIVPYENWSYNAQYNEAGRYYKYYCIGGALEVSVRDKKLVLENAYLAQTVASVTRACFIGDFAYIFINGEGVFASFDRKTGEIIDTLNPDNDKYTLIPNDVPIEDILF